MLSRKHLGVTLADPGVLRAVSGAGFYLFIVTLVGLGLGAIIRHTAGAIAAVGLIFIQALLVNLVFPDPGSTEGHYVLLWAGQRSAQSGRTSPATRRWACRLQSASPTPPPPWPPPDS